ERLAVGGIGGVADLTELELDLPGFFAGVEVPDLERAWGILVEAAGTPIESLAEADHRLAVGSHDRVDVEIGDALEWPDDFPGGGFHGADFAGLIVAYLRRAQSDHLA